MLYTQRAVDAVGLPSLIDRLNVSIDQFNVAYSVSSVINPRAQLTLIGSELTTFTERISGFDANDDNNDVIDFANFAANRKATANADIVVCLVDAGYVDSRGRAFAINAQNDNEGFAIVEVRAIPDQPVFPHEVGHLLGGRHHNDPTSGDAHGYQYEIDFGFLNLGRKDYCTIMCPQMPEEVRRSDRWSNPNVSDGGNPTGTSGFNNVARVIGSNASRIADFRPNTGALGLYVEGEFTVTELGYKTYESVVSCGAGPYTYLWERSNDGFNYFGAETSEFYTFYAYPDGSNSIYLRLTVTSADNRTATTFNRIDFVGYQGSRISANDTFTNDKNLGNQNSLIQIAYPNPTNNQINATIFLSKDDNIKVSMINTQGQEVKSIYQGELSKGNYNFDFSVQNLTSGQYFIKATSTEKSESIKIIVQK